MDPVFEDMFIDLEILERWYARCYISLNEYSIIKNKIVNHCQQRAQQNKKEPNTHAQGV